MAMSGSNKSGSVSEINVTPLIDVLLVLLIIFMVIVPVTPRGLDALIPQPPKDTVVQPVDDNIVVQVAVDTNRKLSYKINQSTFSKSEIESKLAAVFAVRQEKVMFVKGAKDVEFSQVAELIDFGHQAGVENIGLITPKSETAQ